MIAQAALLALAVSTPIKICFPPAVTGTGAAAHLALLQALPPRTADKFWQGGRPDGNGNVGHNRDTAGLWLGGEYQRSVGMWLLRSVALDDLVGLEAGWTGVAAAFSHQTVDGDFERRLADGTLVTLLKDRVSDTAFFLAYYCQAVLVIQQSRFAAIFSARIAAYHNAVREAANFIATADAQAALLGRDYTTINRIVLDALAYQLVGQYLEDASLRAIGDEFLAYALAHQNESGFFVEKSGWDSSYNGTSMWWLQIYDLYSPTVATAEAVSRSAGWELGRVMPTGQVDVTGNTRTGLGQETYQGVVKDVNYPEVSLGLLYYGILQQHSNYATAGLNVCAFRYGTKYCHY